MPINVQDVVTYVKKSAQATGGLVILVGEPGSGKSKLLRELTHLNTWQYIDSRKLVTEELLETLPELRPSTAPTLMHQMLGGYEAEVYLFDRIQVLFAPLLKLDPLSLFQKLSKQHSLVVAWPGSYKEGKLFFSYSGLEDREYNADGIKIISVS